MDSDGFCPLLRKKGKCITAPHPYFRGKCSEGRGAVRCVSIDVPYPELRLRILTAAVATTTEPQPKVQYFMKNGRLIRSRRRGLFCYLSLFFHLVFRKNFCIGQSFKNFWEKSRLEKNDRKFSSCCFKTGENDRFQHKKCKKIQIFTSSKMDQKSI